jgi:hypothetical protein
VSDALERRAKFRELIGKLDLFSHKKWEIVLDPIGVHILEMEDVLFHHNSAVMMPENPQGTSSQDGAGATSESTKKGQEQITGVKALALVFKQFEFNPDQKIIIAGHTDTSGEAKYNFELSTLRSNNILYLLIGDRKKWAKICYKKHKVEDYQQIMQYFWITRGWPCDPGKIDNKWGDNTRHATDGFIDTYNVEYAEKHKTKPLSKGLTKKVNRDSKHRWPESLWRAVYDLYQEDLRSVLGVKPLEMKSLRENRLKFVDDKKKVVGCGESFPVDQAERENYRSQANRRVVILFFDKGEAPVMDCPKTTKQVHKEVECPLWHDWHFTPLYIDPNDLYAVMYHMKFTYYDRVQKVVTDIPEGLKIKAIENGKDELGTSCRYKAGVYSVKVQFKTPLDDKDRKRLHFELETTNQWIYTKDADSTPILVTKTADEIKDLNRIENAAQRIKYYDLPVHWSSRNYWTRYDGDPKKGERFERVFGQIKKFKPFGDALTEPGKPLVFSFDDVALVTEKGDQNLFDHSCEIEARYPKGKTHDLSDKSRVRILYVDPETNYVKVYSTEALPVHPGAGDLTTYHNNVKKFHKASLIKFLKDNDGKFRNLLLAPPGGTRTVIFCGEFYDVTSKRTVKDKKVQFGRGHVVGARAAVLNDKDAQYNKRVINTNKTAVMHSPGTGDFSLHYLHGGGLVDNKLCSYLVVYWTSFVMKDTKPTTGPAATGDKTPATNAEVEEFKDIGMFNSMNHWNKKEYQFQENGVADDDAKHVIRPFHMFEAFEQFKLPNDFPRLDFDDEYRQLVQHDKFKKAMKESRGGVPYSLTFITEEDKGSWVFSARNTTPPFSFISLRISTREDDPNRFSLSRFPSGNKFRFNEFNDPGSYGCLVIAHELGHATGQIDDYMQKAKERVVAGANVSYVSHWVPSYAQFGINEDDERLSAHNNSGFNRRVLSSEAFPIKYDDKAMMDTNGPIRMRHIWRFVNWLNSSGADPDIKDSVTNQPLKPLEKFLSNTQFEIAYKHPDVNNPMLYFRGDAEKKNPWAWSHSGKVYAKPAPNRNRPMNVYFYQKHDETRREGARDYKGILVVRPLLSVKYPGGWNSNKKKNWINWFNKWFTHSKNLLPGHFYLSDGSGSGLDPVIIRFLAGYDFYTGANPGHAHFHYRVVVDTDAGEWDVTGTRITVGNSAAKRKKLFFYLFNKPAASASFDAANFRYLSDWFNSAVVPGGTFTVRKK